MSSTNSGIQDRSSKLFINRYSVLAHVYFFFNSVALPFGMLYTHLLCPVIYFWLINKKKSPVLFPLLVLLLPYDCVHLLFVGVDLKSFIVSNLLFVSTYIFVRAAAWFINHYDSTDKLFRQLLRSNFIFSLVAIVFYFTSYRENFWYINKFTQGVENFYRLALLTYEASYYSLLLVPLVFYFLLRIAFGFETKNRLGILFMTLFPLLLSLSVGVMGAMALAFAVLYYQHRKQILMRKSFFYPLFLAVVLTIFTFLVLLIFFPNNPVFIRITNILTGADTSANGRTIDSFDLAWKIASLKSYWFGVGLGQVKILAPEMVRLYFNFWGKLDVVRIPNAMGETLAIFGITGMIIRLFIISWLFFKTRVWDNYFRTLLFVFVFIYQFTGSFIINIVEYIIWIMAFSNVFTEFNVKQPSPPVQQKNK